MKKILLYLFLLTLAACKEPTISEGILPLTPPATTDPDGGNWQTVVLRSAVSVPAPAAVSSDAYQRELTEVKNGLLGTSPERNTAVTYWAYGGVQRWNQIARQLIAKYNVAPAYDAATGQYAPFNANRPTADAPVAARLLAYLSVAQYDALVMTWRAKFQYNRPALERQGVVPLVPVADLPSYPSEDAAVAEASQQVLAALFPAEADWLRAKATEHKQSRVWAGACVPSDLQAGETLGGSVATAVVSRARADGFAQAHDPGNTWPALLARAPYDVKWQSLEIPARMPVLPLAGSVQTWFDAEAVGRTAPGPPPATTSPAFQQALAEVRTVSDSRSREQWRIADFWSDGVGSYAVAGHWNRIAEELVQQNAQNELRAARTYALLNRALHDATTVAWQTKYRYFVPRPSQMDARIKTAALIPNFPSYPSNHALSAASAAAVLGYLFPADASKLDAQANEAALSRVYAGTNYRFDIDEGQKTGVAVGKLTADWAKADGAK